MKQRPQLARLDSIAISLGVVVGAGIFRVPAEVARLLPSAPLILLAWLAGGAISLLGALCFARLSATFPQSGGSYIYLRQGWGLGTGFLFAWAELLVIRPGSIAAMALICAAYLRALLGLPESWSPIVAIALVAAISGVNISGLRPASWLQNLTTWSKVLALAVLATVGFAAPSAPPTALATGSGGAPEHLLAAFGLALIPILWTYGGWHESTFVAGETADARRSLPLSLVAGAAIVTLLYVAMNGLYLHLLPVASIAATPVVASEIMELLFGRAGESMIEVFIVVSSLGAINALLLTGSRLTAAVTADHSVFRWLGARSERGVPARAISLNGGWTVALLLLGTFEQLLFYTGAVFWLFFGLTVAALFRIRPRAARGGLASLTQLLVPALFIGICAWLCLNTVYSLPRESLAGVALTAAGLPLFALARWRELRSRPGE